MKSLLDTFTSDTDEGRQLRGGLLNMGIGLLSGSTGNYGQFAPALAQGFAGYQQGRQQVIDDNFKKQQIAQMQAMRNMQMQSMQRLQKEQEEAQSIISSGIDYQSAMRHANPHVRDWAMQMADTDYKNRALNYRLENNNNNAPVGTPFEAVRDGKPVLVQRYTDGRLEEVPGFQPKPSGGFSVVTNPDGTVSVSTGGNGGNQKLTEQQSKDLVYLTRGESSIKILDDLENSLTNTINNTVGSLPGGNHFVGENYQKANQAGKDFLAAILRKDTGAAITSDEMKIYGAMYLPQPGDSAGVIEQKRKARRVALDAIRKGLGGLGDSVPSGLAPTIGTSQSQLAAQQKRVVKTGVFNGRKVVQYDDGSVAYMD